MGTGAWFLSSGSCGARWREVPLSHCTSLRSWCSPEGVAASTANSGIAETVPAPGSGFKSDSAPGESNCVGAVSLSSGEESNKKSSDRVVALHVVKAPLQSSAATRTPGVPMLLEPNPAELLFLFGESPAHTKAWRTQVTNQPYDI